MARRVTNEDWLNEIEDSLDSLRSRRDDLESELDEDDFEASELFASAERRWRRIDRKLEEARKNGRRPLNRARARNVDVLVEAIEEVYYELENGLG